MNRDFARITIIGREKQLHIKGAREIRLRLEIHFTEI